MSDEVKAVRAVVDAWLQATSRKDAKGVVAETAPYPLDYSLAPPLVTDTTSTDGLEAWFETWEGPIGLELADVTVHAGDTVAFVTGLGHMTGTKTAAEGGYKADLWFRETIGLTKTGGRWRIVHDHQSVPFYMDGSFKAAIDLKP